MEKKSTTDQEQQSKVPGEVNAENNNDIAKDEISEESNQQKTQTLKQRQLNCEKGQKEDKMYIDVPIENDESDPYTSENISRAKYSSNQTCYNENKDIINTTTSYEDCHEDTNIPVHKEENPTRYKSTRPRKRPARYTS
uniref:Uncharacterized protein n=1 Tax=Arundo donax TaxID=35708 RepID=A0A0A9DQ42_ARUDO